jgi:para-aminobenzoate synthetase component 1
MSSSAVITTSAVTSTTPERLFAPLAHQLGAVWLDSSLHFGDRGRYSFIARRPSLDISFHNGVIVVLEKGQQTKLSRTSTINDFLEQIESHRNGFVIGYIAYEATLPFLGLTESCPASPVPVARFLFYDSVLRFEHPENRITVTHPEYDDYSDLFQIDASDASCVEDVFSEPEIAPTLTHDEYIDRIDRIKWHIHEGDIYQVNFTTRFDVHSRTNPFTAYTRLRRLNPSPYGAYLNFGNYHILSSSPERMFKKDGAHITTSPIKGTIERGDNPLEETQNRRRLRDSEKDRAELLMIVDLERNDLGKIAHIGSVRVDELFKTEVYSSLIHLVSDISAHLKPEVRLPDIFRALLPGGSITGAPKRRAVEIINQLETTPRSVYTGCIGYLDGDRADFNIAIRTMLYRDGVYHVHAGGGIVDDSDPEAEYQEMLLKAGNLLRALGVEPKRVIL